MSTFNLSYGLEGGPLPVGTVADSRHTHTITGISEVATPIGVPVGWDDLVLTADAPMKGVTRGSSSLIQSDAGVVELDAGKAFDILSFGPIVVNASGAVTAGVAAYAVISGDDIGQFSATAGVTTTTNPVGFFETAGTDVPVILFVTRQAFAAGA